MWYFVVFQPSKCKKTHFQPQIWSIWPIFPNDSESLPEVCCIKRNNSEILSKFRNSEPAEVSDQKYPLRTKFSTEKTLFHQGGYLAWLKSHREHGHCLLELRRLDCALRICVWKFVIRNTSQETFGPPLGLQRWLLFLPLHRQEEKLSPGMICQTLCSLVTIAGLSHLIEEALLGQNRLKCLASHGSGEVNRGSPWPSSTDSFTTGRHLVIFFKDKMVITSSEVKAAVRYF